MDRWQFCLLNIGDMGEYDALVQKRYFPSNRRQVAPAEQRESPLV